jgi:hypothetical protein
MLLPAKSTYDLVINGITYNDVKVGQVIDSIKPKPQNKKIWDSIPAPKSFEDSPVELGVKFKSSVAGYVKGIRLLQPQCTIRHLYGPFVDKHRDIN